MFANGITFKKPSEKAPDFVIGNLSVKKSEFIKFLNEQPGEWVNLNIKTSKAGNPYIDVYEAKKKTEPEPELDKDKGFGNPDWGEAIPADSFTKHPPF
jgi:hypothetical protein